MWSILRENHAELISGVLTTLWISAAALLIGAVLGLAIAAARRSHKVWLQRLSRTYLSFWRGTPILIQLFLVFYLLPLAGVDLSPSLAAVVALALNTAAFQSEIYRAGLNAVPQGEIEAARMLGLSSFSSFLRIAAPQAVRTMLPALVGEVLALVRNSSLISAIAVADITRRSQQIASTTYHPLESYSAALLCYLILAAVFATAGLWLEKRLGARKELA